MTGKKFGAGRAVILALWIAAIALFWFNRDKFTLDGVLMMSPANRVLAALVLLGLFALKSLSVVMYCGILFAASGILFPLPIAIIINLCGSAIMCTISYLMGRQLGAGAVEELRKKYPKLEVLKDMRRGNDFFYSFLLRALNILPLDVTSAYLGAAGLKYTPYLWGSQAGMLSSCVLFPILGMNINTPMSPEFLISLGIEGCVSLGAITGFILLRKKHLKQNGQ